MLSKLSYSTSLVRIIGKYWVADYLERYYHQGSHSYYMVSAKARKGVWMKEQGCYGFSGFAGC
jgi:hypothetical protein